MEQLITMGFTKKKDNLKALILTSGNIPKATEMIVNAQMKHQANKEKYATMEYNPTPEEIETMNQIKNMGFNLKPNTKNLSLIRKVKFIFNYISFYLFIYLFLYFNIFDDN